MRSPLSLVEREVQKKQRQLSKVISLIEFLRNKLKYKERIENYQYNKLVVKADKIARSIFPFLN